MVSTNILDSLLTTDNSDVLSERIDQHQLDCNRELWSEWRGIALQHAFAGDRTSAISIAMLLIKIGQLKNTDAVSGYGHWLAANVHTVSSQPTLAQPHYKKATGYFLADNDRLSLARMRVGEVAMLNQLSSYDDALTLAQDAMLVLSNSDNPADQKRCAGLANNRAIAFEYLGRYEEAIDNYLRKMAVWEKWPEDPRSRIEIARAQINVGVLKSQINLYVEAERALSAGRQQLLGVADKRYRLDIARAEMHLARLDARSGRPAERVRQAFHKARQRCEQSDGLMGIDLYETEWEIATGNLSPDVLPRLEGLREQLIENGAQRDAIRAQLLTGRYFLQKGAIQKSQATFKDALEQSKQLNDWDNRYRAEHGLGLSSIADAQLDQAFAYFSDAINTIESVSIQVTDITQKASFRDDKLTVYQDLIALHWGRNQWEAAFATIERARAQQLNELLGSGTTLIGDGPITLSALRQVLALDTILLMFVCVHDQLWVWPIGNTLFYEPFLLGDVEPFQSTDAQLRHIHGLNQQPMRLITRHHKQLIATATAAPSEWFDTLFAPIESILNKHQHVLICPDGPLWRLPIHAAFDKLQQKHLLETHSVRFIPSSSTWLRLQHRRRRSRLAVGIAYNGSVLDHAKREVEQIAATYPKFECVLGSSATRAVMRSDCVQSADILHLAAHAVFRADTPIYSYIELADGRLEMQDVLKLKLSASLVVLSACETGRGLASGGEFLGLANAFLMAGARSVLVTQWRVDDLVSAEMMTHFYRGLRQNLPAGEALRQAQVHLMHNAEPHHAHPYYWAPYYLLGYDPVH